MHSKQTKMSSPAGGARSAAGSTDVTKSDKGVSLRTPVVISDKNDSMFAQEGKVHEIVLDHTYTVCTTFVVLFKEKTNTCSSGINS